MVEPEEMNVVRQQLHKHVSARNSRKLLEAAFSMLSVPSYIGRAIGKKPPY
jgi:hypothetical protein